MHPEVCKPLIFDQKIYGSEEMITDHGIGSTPFFERVEIFGNSGNFWKFLSAEYFQMTYY